MIFMFVIIQHGGKQYWAKEGDVLALEKIDGEIGKVIELDAILSKQADKLNTTKQIVKATIVEHYRDAKVISFKKIRRHHHERKKGHRQPVTSVKIGAFV